MASLARAWALGGLSKQRPASSDLNAQCSGNINRSIYLVNLSRAGRQPFKASCQLLHSQMKSRVPKNISTQVCLLSTHLGVVLNHQAISSALRGHLPTRFPPEAGECWGTGNSEAGGWRLPTELDSNWTEPGLHPHLSLAVSLWTKFSIPASGCPSVRWV